MNIQELKRKTSEQLIDDAEKLGIENASTLRRQEILFAILKKHAEKERKLLGEEFFSYFKMVLAFLGRWSQITCLAQMTSTLAQAR